MEQPEQSSRKTRYSRESVLDQNLKQDIDGEVDGEHVADESRAETKSAFRSESIRGQPGGNGLIWRRLQTAGISVRKRWSEIMLQRKEGRKRRLPKKSKTAKRESARYRETSEVDGRFPGWIFGGDQRQVEAGMCAERTAEKSFPIVFW